MLVALTLVFMDMCVPTARKICCQVLDAKERIILLPNKALSCHEPVIQRMADVQILLQRCLMVVQRHMGIPDHTMEARKTMLPFLWRNEE